MIPDENKRALQCSRDFFMVQSLLLHVGDFYVKNIDLITLLPIGKVRTKLRSNICSSEVDSCNSVTRSIYPIDTLLLAFTTQRIHKH